MPPTIKDTRMALGLVNGVPGRLVLQVPAYLASTAQEPVERVCEVTVLIMKLPVVHLMLMQCL